MLPRRVSPGCGYNKIGNLQFLTTPLGSQENCIRGTKYAIRKALNFPSSGNILLSPFYEKETGPKMLLAQIDVDTARKLMTEQNYTVAGVVLVILAVVVFGVWRVLSWTATNVAIPGRDRLFRYVDSSIDTMTATVTTMRNVSENLEKLAEVPERLERMELKVDGLAQKMERVDSHLSECESRRTS